MADAARVAELRGMREVASARAPEVLFLHLDVNGAENGAIAARHLLKASGAGTLVAIIDTGIDWTHPDFRGANGQTRIKALWDQFDDSYEISNGTIGSPPPVTGMGTVYTQDQIDGALAGLGIVASRDLVGHGTLVASAAAGNDRAGASGPSGETYVGTAPEADLLVVRAGGLDASDRAIGGDIVAALAWVDEQATSLGKPVVVNMSFGGHVGPHDGTMPEEVAIDEFARRPGRAAVVSAGNEGALNVHASGSARGSHTLRVYQAGESEVLLIDCWLPGSDRVDLGFRGPSPGADSWVPDANVRENTCKTYRGSANEVSLCLFDVDRLNGKREVAFAVEPAGPWAPISAGIWEFTFRDEGGVLDGRFDCWSALGQQFAADVDGSVTIAQPGTSAEAITAGALAARDKWPSLAGPARDPGILVGGLAPFSSAGPTADGRLKPDLVTGGQVVVGAWASGDGSGSAIAGSPPSATRVAADGAHVAASGTSFSAPQVAGAVALLMERDPRLNGPSARAILTGTARADAFTGTVPNERWGYGKLDVAAALAAVAALATPTATAFPSPPAVPTATPHPSPTPRPREGFTFRGDVNCDGVLTPQDLVASPWFAQFSKGALDAPQTVVETRPSALPTLPASPALSCSRVPKPSRALDRDLPVDAQDLRGRGGLCRLWTAVVPLAPGLGGTRPSESRPLTLAEQPFSASQGQLLPDADLDGSEGLE